MTKVFLGPLKHFGWSRICLKCPNFAARIGHEILTASEWDRGKRNKADLAALDRICDGVQLIAQNYGALSSETQNMINFQAERFVGADIETVSKKHFEELLVSLDPIVSAMLTHKSHLDADVSELPRSKKNISTHQIAAAIAELYVVGLGEKPKFGKDHSTYELNGVFAKVAFQVFEILEIPFSRQTSSPFAAAIKRLSDEKMEELLHLHRNGEQKLSLFGGGFIKSKISLFYDFNPFTGRRFSEVPAEGQKASKKNLNSPLD